MARAKASEQRLSNWSAFTGCGSQAPRWLQQQQRRWPPTLRIKLLLPRAGQTGAPNGRDLSPAFFPLARSSASSCTKETSPQRTARRPPTRAKRCASPFHRGIASQLLCIRTVWVLRAPGQTHNESGVIVNDWLGESAAALVAVLRPNTVFVIQCYPAFLPAALSPQLLELAVWLRLPCCILSSLGR